MTGTTGGGTGGGGGGGGGSGGGEGDGGGATPHALQSAALAGDATLDAVAAGHATLSPSQTKQDAVAKFQRALNRLSVVDAEYFINLGATDQFAGFYGPITARAVRALQHDHALPLTGEVNAATLLALDAALVALEATPPAAPAPAPAAAPVAAPAAVAVVAPASVAAAAAPAPAAPHLTASTVWRTESGYAHDKDHPGKGWARTTGITGTKVTAADGSQEWNGAETLTAVRGSHAYGAVEASQRRVIRNGVHTIEQAGYCRAGRAIPNAEFRDHHPGLSGLPGAVSAISTQFGKSDDLDEGTGSEYFGVTQTSSEVCGCSVKASRLEAWFGPGWRTDERRLRALVEVYFPNTHRYAKLPLTDVGPSPSRPAEIDLTWAPDQFLGTDGGDHVWFRLVPESIA